MPTDNVPRRDPAAGPQVLAYHYRREILLAVLILLLAGAGFAGYRIYCAQLDSAAAAHLASAKAPGDYEQVIREYGITPAGASAYLLLADAQRKDRKFSESNTTLQSFIDKHPEHQLIPTARLAMAANLEGMGKVDEALSLYQQTATKYAKTFAAPIALVSQVALLKAKNQPDAARRVCETVLSQYGESFWAGEAMRELRSLKPALKPADAAAQSASPATVQPPMMLPPPAAAPAAAVPPVSAPPASPAPPKKK